MAFDAGAVIGRAIFDDSKWQSGTKGLKQANTGMTKSIFAANLAYDAFKKVLSVTIDEVKKAINVAKDFQEENSKFRTVFRDVGDAATKMRQKLVDSYGLSRKASTELLASTGDLLTGFGFAQETALDLSGEVQKLAVDLASFTNFSGGAEGASAALTKALLGERESVKSLGISILETDVKTKVLELTQQGMTFETERQAKAYATLLIAQEQSRNAIGDYARTSDQLANRQRQLTAVTEDLQIQIGTIFIPIINDFTGSMLESAKGLRDFLDSAEGIEILSTIFAGIKATVPIVVDTLKDFGIALKDDILKALDDLMPSFESLIGEAGKGVTVFDIFVGVIEGLGIAFSITLKVSKLIIQTFVDLLVIIKETTKAAILLAQALFDPRKWKNVEEQIGELTESFKDLGKNIITNVSDIVETTIDEFAALPENIKDNSEEIESIWKNSFEKNKKIFKQNIKDMTEIAKEGTDDIGEEIETLAQKMRRKLGEANKKIMEGFDGLGKDIMSTVGFVVDQIGSILDNTFDLITTNFDNQLEVLQATNEDELDEIEKQKITKLEKLDSSIKEERIRKDADLAQGRISKEEHDRFLIELEKRRKNQEEEINTSFNERKLNAEKKNIEKENAIEEKRFKANKANQIAQVWIEAAAGIIAAWAGAVQALAWIPVAGPGLAIAMGATLSGIITGFAIAQTVQIAKQQFIPKKQFGGRAFGPTIMNEVGGEMVNLPDGSIVVPNEMSRQIAMNAGSGMKTTNISVSFAGAKISDNMSLRKVSNFVLGDMAKKLRLAQ